MSTDQPDAKAPDAVVGQPSSSHARRLTAALAAGMVAIGVLCNPFAYPFWARGESLDSAEVWGIAWLLCSLLVAGGLLLFAFRRRIPPANLLLLMVSCLLSFLLAEAALAALGITPLRRIVLSTPPLEPWWEASEETGSRYLRDYYDGPWTINVAGCPDRDEFLEVTARRADARVLLLGDSFAFGAQASSYDHSFAEILDRDLKRNLKGVLWNTSIPGIGQKQELHSLRAYFPLLQPQLVLLAFCMNDFGDNLFPVGQHYVFEGGQWVSRYELNADGSVRILGPEEAYRRAFAVRGLAELPKASRVLTLTVAAARKLRGELQHRTSGVAAPDEMAGPSAHNSAYKTTKELLDSIRSYLTEHNVALLVLLVPDREDLPERGNSYSLARNLCLELHIEVVEVADALAPEDYKAPPDTHWNDSGHRKVAEALIPRVRGILATREIAQKDEANNALDTWGQPPIK